MRKNKTDGACPVSTDILCLPEMYPTGDVTMGILPFSAS